MCGGLNDLPETSVLQIPLYYECLYIIDTSTGILLISLYIQTSLCSHSLNLYTFTDTFLCPFGVTLMQFQCHQKLFHITQKLVVYVCYHFYETIFVFIFIIGLPRQQCVYYQTVPLVLVPFSLLGWKV